MTFSIIVLLVLAVFVLILKTLEDKMVKIGKRQRDSDTRISGLEIKDFGQDLRLDAQQRHIKELKQDVDELGKDLGWTDDKRRTQVLKQNSDDTE